jgi:hypothetical protein
MFRLLANLPGQALDVNPSQIGSFDARRAAVNGSW